MNTIVDFERAKLLKEKGFDKPCRFVHDNWNNIIDWYDNDEEYHRNSEKNASVYYSAPTIAEVVCWLYEKHGIWISVDIDVWNTKLCDFTIVGGSDSYDNPYHYESDDKFNSPTEAYESAITYTLNNLV